MRLQRKRTKRKAKGFSLTPEAKALASKFELNKGKLPWPVANALVVRNFGKIPHKTLSGITIQSNGIHIATNKGADAQAIFEGSVLAIQIGSSGIKTVMVQHGNYISLYSNLATVAVKKRRSDFFESKSWKNTHRQGHRKNHFEISNLERYSKTKSKILVAALVAIFLILQTKLSILSPLWQPFSPDNTKLS